MRNILYFCLLCLVLQSHFSKATADKFRLTWRGDPSTTMVIGWNQISGSNPVVYYGTTDYGTNYNQYSSSRKPDRIVVYNGMNNHFVRLTGLLPNTAYYFVVRDNQGVSRRYWFKTAPNSPSARLSIIAGGDSRDGRSQRQNANKLVSKLRPHVVLFGGDMTRSNYDDEWKTWFDDWQLTIGADGRIIPLVAARGNHETSDEIIVNHFDVPHANAYYALNFGGSLLRVYTLNSESSVAGEQTTWLANDLIANAGSTWRMAQYHRPMRPHTGSKSEGNVLYQYWASLFHQHRVKLVIECDAHVVKSTWPVVPSSTSGSDEGFIRNDTEGTVYVGEGGWGTPLRINDDDKNWTRSSGMFNQFHWIFVDRDKIEARFVKTDNADAVGTVSDANIFAAPANLDVWSPGNGSVITIPASVPDNSLTVTSVISAGSDDAEERSNGAMSLASTDLELVYDNSSTGNQTIGLRFAGLNIPRGVSITEATIRFATNEVSTEATALSIKGDDTDNSLTFTTTTGNTSSRPKTTASTSWTPVPWSITGMSGSDQTTPNLKNIVQEIVNRTGWTSGNAMSFIITGTGKRSASAYEKSSAVAAVLKIKYAKTSTASPVTTTYAITDGTDDVEETSGGVVSRSSTDLELVYDNSTTGNQIVGVRFRNIRLPKGSVVANAYLQFTTDEISSATTPLTIRAEDTGNSLPITTESRNLSVRSLTSASATWTPPAWDVAGETSGDQRSPDLKSILSEIIARNGWAEGNSMTFIITGTGKRIARAFEHSPATAARLIITHIPPTTAVAASLPEQVVLPESTQFVEVSPNPADDHVSIKLASGFKGGVVSYAFMTETGATVLSAARRVESAVMNVDVSTLSRGLYILKVVTREGAGAVKVIKK